MYIRVHVEMHRGTYLREFWICSLHPASIFHNLSFCSSTGLMFPITATLHSVETSLYQRV